MNILLIGDGDTKYGAVHSLYQMATSLNNLADLNISVILNQNSPLAEKMRENGITVRIVQYTPFYQGMPDQKWMLPLKYLIRGIQYWNGRRIAIHSCDDFIKNGQFDLIHSNSSREDLGAQLSEYYGIPLIWHIREFGDLDYKCYSYRRDYIGLMNRIAVQFIAVSDAVKEHWIKKGIDSQKIITVYNGVKSRGQEQIAQRERKPGESVRFVFTGNIHPIKGQMQAVKMMAKLREKGVSAQLDIIGDGQRLYLKQLQAVIKSKGLENSVRFLGYRNDVEDLLLDYDIGIVSSCSEGFGRVTAEYMMAGLSVLASNTGANSELIREGIDGFLYKYGDINDMTEKAMAIIEKLNIGGLQTYRYALNMFSDSVNAMNIHNIYKDILKNYQNNGW